MKKRILSGIQPTGQIHIGNYLGAIKQWVQFQDEYECVFSVVDMHAITVPPYDAKELRRKIRELAALLIACGVDPEKSTLFVQSEVVEHAELSWVLNCITPLGWLQRMTQFKEKSEQHKDNSSAGLFVYPALQAADILLYDTDLVPVGEDQKQHIEITRDIAQRFNHLFGETFKMPDFFIPEVAARVMGLDDPTKKMSKSLPGSNHSINLMDKPDDIIRKIKRAVTDSERTIVFNKNREGLYNLLNLYAAFKYDTEDLSLTNIESRTDLESVFDTDNTDPQLKGKTTKGIFQTLWSDANFPEYSFEKEIEQHFDGKGYKELKQELGELIVEKLKPIQQRYAEIKKDKSYLRKVLYEGAQKAREVASPICKKAKKAAGLGS